MATHRRSMRTRTLARVRSSDRHATIIRLEGNATTASTLDALRRSAYAQPASVVALAPGAYAVTIRLHRRWGALSAGARLDARLLAAPNGSRIDGRVKPDGRAAPVAAGALHALAALSQVSRAVDTVAAGGGEPRLHLLLAVAFGYATVVFVDLARRWPAEAAERLRAEVLLALHPW